MGELDPVRVSHARWLRAQRWEKLHWVRTQELRARWRKNLAWRLLARLGLRERYRGDDWNHWWKERLDHYSFLPERVDRMIELGCGPYTNARLIVPICRPEHLVLSDPLIPTYAGFHLTFVAEMKGRADCKLDDTPIEECPFPDDSFDVCVLINVLDHVRDADLCMAQAVRITKPGGVLIVGQDLSNAEDRIAGREGDIGHPIRVDHEWLDERLLPGLEAIRHTVLCRGQGRAPEAHYGTYLFAGHKRAP